MSCPVHSDSFFKEHVSVVLKEKKVYEVFFMHTVATISAYHEILGEGENRRFQNTKHQYCAKLLFLIPLPSSYDPPSTLYNQLT